MTLGEFKAWLDGYSEGFENGVPSAEQWAKIKEKLEAVSFPVPRAIDTYRGLSPNIGLGPIQPNNQYRTIAA